MRKEEYNLNIAIYITILPASKFSIRFLQKSFFISIVIKMAVEYLSIVLKIYLLAL